MKKCLHGRSQNPKESLNNVIWTRIQKNVFVGFETLKLGVRDAVLSFNDGHIRRCEVVVHSRLGMAYGIGIEED